MLPRERCSGCTACAAVCPKQCITMIPNRDGFLYPHIQDDACIHCRKCEHACPVLHCNTPTLKIPMAFASKNLNEDCRLKSSSGGVFSALAEHVIAQGGIVFGAAISEDKQVKHISAENMNDLVCLRGSKYVSSFLGNTFWQVLQQLQSGRVVLFSGTPCQVEGLLSILKQPYQNLLTVDFVCHGVPSAKVWKEYLKYQERQNGAKVHAVSFRNKETGWKNFSMKIGFANGGVYSAPMRDDPYLHAFLDNLCLRPSCHDCAFKGANRSSDITLADFWGIQTVMPEEDDDRGTSLVFVHSEKGRSLLEQLNGQITIKETDAASAIDHNSAMVKSVPAYHFRQYFFHMLGKKRFDKLVNNCFNPSYTVRLHRMALIKASALLQRKVKSNGEKQK